MIDGIGAPQESQRLDGIKVPEVIIAIHVKPRRRVMGIVCQIGPDIAKNTFQVHGVDKHGKELFNKKLKRAAVLPFFVNLPACLVGLEACGGSSFGAD